MYKNFLTLIPTLALTFTLAACGGSGSSTSKTQPEKQPEAKPSVLTISGNGLQYLAIQEGAGEWEKLTLSKHSILLKGTETDINIASYCEERLEITQINLTKDIDLDFTDCSDKRSEFPKVKVESSTAGYTLLETMISDSFGSGNIENEITLNPTTDEYSLISYAIRNSDNKIFAVKQTELTLVNDQVISIDFSTAVEVSLQNVPAEQGLDYGIDYRLTANSPASLDIQPSVIEDTQYIQLPASVLLDTGAFEEDWNFGVDSELSRVVEQIGTVASGFEGEIPQEYTQASFTIAQDKKSMEFIDVIPSGLNLKSSYIEFDINDDELNYSVQESRLLRENGKVKFELLDLTKLPEYNVSVLAETINDINISTYSQTDNWPAVGSAKLMLNTAQQY